MFILKKIISAFLMPMPFCLLLIFAGLFLLWFTRRQKMGKVFVTVGAIVLTLCGYDIFARHIIKPLERQYPAFAINAEIQSSVRWIVVLGGGAAEDDFIAPTNQLSNASLARVVEGVRIQRTMPQAKLLLSGGSVFGSPPEAEIMRAVAEALGVERATIVLETESRDTEDQARNIRSIVGDDAHVLVTSAAHLPRSVALFNKLDMHPVPAPTDYEAFDSKHIGVGSFFPNASALYTVGSAIHEYLGQTWTRIRGSG
ncbi:MAG: envelope biogenesis factor ElyC [Pyrinomonadaceae bacterium MAG19_C2-C3]|nr:envelope biogenesis factor ElyC [Pyrinomonadaceae bacterium MAG19_C2-C3]